jgi:hypothetical protein
MARMVTGIAPLLQNKIGGARYGWRVDGEPANSSGNSRLQFPHP